MGAIHLLRVCLYIITKIEHSELHTVNLNGLLHGRVTTSQREQMQHSSSIALLHVLVNQNAWRELFLFFFDRFFHDTDSTQCANFCLGVINH
jgi:ABC-type Mn2+/Zn2+ transport system permease subunit